MAALFPRRLRILPRTCAARGRLAVGVLIAGLLGSAGFAAYEWRRAALDERDFEAQTLLALALHASVAPEPTSTDEPWRAPLTQAGRRLLWAGCVDPNAQGVELRRATATGLATADIVRQVDFTARVAHSRPLHVAGLESPRLRLLTMPPDSGGRVIAAVIDHADAPRALNLGLFVGALGAALAACFTGVMLLNRAVLAPLDRFAQAQLDIQAGLTPLASAGLPEDLAQVATGFRELHADIQRWRGEAQRLQRTLDERVDARTHRAELARRRAERAADTDALTGLANRRVLDRDLPALFDRSRASGADLAVMLLDVDHFKHVNDCLGHATGDELLALLGDLLRGTLRRDGDIAVRLGGDEFLLVLANTSASDAELVAQRLAALFAQRARTLNCPPPLPALSAGVVSLATHAPTTWNALLDAADAGMYRRKRGRSARSTAEE